MKKILLLCAALGITTVSFAQGLSQRAAQDSSRKAWLNADTRFEQGNWRLNVTPIFQGALGSGDFRAYSLGLGLGVGYFPVRNLAADLDFSFSRAINKPVDVKNENHLTGRLMFSYYVKVLPGVYYTPGISTSLTRYSYTPSDSIAYFADVANSGRQNHAIVTGTIWPVGVAMKLTPRTSLQFNYGFSKVLNHPNTDNIPYGRNPQNMMLKLQFGLGRK